LVIEPPVVGAVTAKVMAVFPAAAIAVGIVQVTSAAALLSGVQVALVALVACTPAGS